MDLYSKKNILRKAIESIIPAESENPYHKVGWNAALEGIKENITEDFLEKTLKELKWKES